MKQTRRWLVATAIAIILLVLIVLIVPFLIDFNQFKPQIQKAVADKMNAQVDFASARLHIFPGLGVKITKVSLTNTDPEFAGIRTFAVDEIFFSTELSALLEKKLVGEIRIDKPDIIMAKKGLKNNFAALMKPSATPSQPTPNEPKQPEGTGSGTDFKDKITVKALDVKNASFKIADLASPGHEPVKINDFDLRVQNIGLDRDIVTELATKLAVRDQGTEVEGPVVLQMRNRVTMNNQGLDKATFQGKLDFDLLGINVRDAFVKPRGIPLHVTFDGQATGQSLTVETLDLTLHNLFIKAKADIKDFTALNSRITVAAANPDLSELGTILPQHKALLNKGTLALQADAQGPLSQANKVQAGAKLALTLAGSDLRFEGNVNSMKPLVAKADINSRRLDLGALLKPFLPPETAPHQDTSQASSGTTTPSSPPPTTEAAKDFALTPEQKKMLAGADIKVAARLDEIIYDTITIKDLRMDANVKDTIANLQDLSLQGFGGQLKTAGRVDLGASPIAFQNTFALKGVQAGELIGAIAPAHRQLVLGKLTLDMNAKGQGTTVPTLSKTLDGSGSFVFTDGELHTGSVSQKMQEEFDKFVSKQSIVAAADDVFAQAEKLLQNPMVQSLPQAQSFNLDKYRQSYRTLNQVKLGERLDTDKGLKEVKGNIAIKQGRIFLDTKPTATSQGTFTFDGSVGLDTSLAGTSVFTAQESLKQKLLSQSQYAKLLFDDKGNLTLSMNLGGTVVNPTVSLVTKALQDRFTSESRQLVEKEVRKGAEDFLSGLMKGKQNKLLDEAKKKVEELKAGTKGNQDEAKKKAAESAKKQLNKLFGK